MLSLKGEGKLVSSPTKNYEKEDYLYEGKNVYWNEGPFVIKHNGIYHLMYSANYFASRDYCLCCAISKYPNKEFCLIMGSDNLCTIDKWKNYQQILDNYKIFVYPRPEYLNSEWEKHKNVTMVEAPMMSISASYVRNAIKEGKSVKYLLTNEVIKYIDEMNFYK